MLPPEVLNLSLQAVHFSLQFFCLFLTLASSSLFRIPLFTQLFILLSEVSVFGIKLHVELHLVYFVKLASFYLNQLVLSLLVLSILLLELLL